MSPVKSKNLSHAKASNEQTFVCSLVRLIARMTNGDATVYNIMRIHYHVFKVTISSTSTCTFCTFNNLTRIRTRALHLDYIFMQYIYTVQETFNQVCYLSVCIVFHLSMFNLTWATALFTHVATAILTELHFLYDFD